MEQETIYTTSGYGLTLVTVDTNTVPCSVTGSPQTFSTNSDVNAAQAMIDYVKSIPNDTWIIGISTQDIHLHLAAAFDYFLEYLAVDLSVLVPNAALSFVARKDDLFRTRVRHFGTYLYGPVVLVTDLTYFNKGISFR